MMIEIEKPLVSNGLYKKICQRFIVIHVIHVYINILKVAVRLTLRIISERGR